ncbi:MAG: SGNH/GDSL hydrolase family protein, partial [Candidatus Ornithomonoglobus sp.]
AHPITKIRGRLTFNGSGDLYFISDNRTFLDIRYSGDGIYANDSLITSKDNMEFEAVIDKNNGKVYFTQNDESTELSLAGTLNTIDGITGANVTLEYIGVAYSDDAKATLKGPDNISSAFCRLIAGGMSYAYAEYEIVYSYKGAVPPPKITVSGIDGAYIDIGDYTFSGNRNAYLIVPQGSEGTAVICADFNGHKTYKTVGVYNNPTPGKIEYIKSPVNLYSTGTFGISGYDDYGVSELYDEYGNKVYSAVLTLTDFRSSDESVISIDNKGVMTAKSVGSAVISATVTLGGCTISAEYTVGGFYIDSITEAETSYTLNTLTTDKNVSSYRVSYSDGKSEEVTPTQIPAAQVMADGTVITAIYDTDGKLSCVQKQDVKAGDKVLPSNGNKSVYLYSPDGFEKITDADTTLSGFELEHSAGAEYEITPVYTFTDIGDIAEPKTLDAVFPDGCYDITFKKAETFRGDIYVNGAMVGNNVDQADADRKVTDGALYTAEDVKITGGKISVSMTDGSTVLDYVTVTKKPEFYERPQRVYVIGDSLACAYYGDFEHEVGGGRAGWGQQLPDFLNVPVTNLANSGQFAAGLYVTAFPGVIENAQEGDILLIECGYNDRAYSTRDEMISCVKSMIEECREKGIIPILVTPNASAHDYKPSVVWSGYLRDIAVDTECQLIDLSQKSYDLLYSIYGDDSDGNITKNFNLTEVGGDTLHSSYAGAYVWASVVAQGLKDLGYGDIVKTDFTYSFIDTLGNEITAQVK